MRRIEPRIWSFVGLILGSLRAFSPYNYTNCNPINCIDPDGNVVIFINGQHTGEGGQAKYWEGFDIRAMKMIGDNNARYVDGAMGGWKATLTNIKTNNTSYKDRIAAGKIQGLKDASSIIAHLSQGETIKIVTHSMGTAFARGYVRGLVEYAQKNDQLNKLYFAYELDVNSYDGNHLPPEPELYNKTGNETGGEDGSYLNMVKKRKMSISGVGRLPGPGVTYIGEATNKNNGHAIKYMTTEQVPTKNGQGLSQKAIIEEGVNNEKAPNQVKNPNDGSCPRY